MKRELDTFERYVTEFGVKTINEGSNSPQEYCRLYRDCYLPSEQVNKARGARIVWIEGPEEKYRAAGERILTVSVGKPMQARYVKVEIEGIKICPSCHYGVGYPCWLVINEVSVR